MNKISLTQVILSWKDKFKEMPSIHIFNTEENTWTLIVRKRSAKRGSMATFSDEKYTGVLVKALSAGQDKNFLVKINPEFLETANILKDLRIKLNLTQAKFSKMLGVSQSLYSDFEHGKTRISTEIMEKAKEFSMEVA